ncbi:MAG: hypothetical protein JSV65_01640 [Armatimonadota bacterium]|nr:MAG: hypothetical protein JSV65_01640 [Armatimonadota bacterium]
MSVVYSAELAGRGVNSTLAATTKATVRGPVTFCLTTLGGPVGARDGGAVGATSPIRHPAAAAC